LDCLLGTAAKRKEQGSPMALPRPKKYSDTSDVHGNNLSFPEMA
jgi:hypothetical protein